MAEKTGTDLLRAALRQRSFKGSLALIARDLNTSVGSLDAFMRGTGKLPPETLQALARELFAGATLDLEIDRLRPANRNPPTPFATALPPSIPELVAAGVLVLPKFTAGAHVFRKPEPVPVKKATRPGWVE